MYSEYRNVFDQDSEWNNLEQDSNSFNPPNRFNNFEQEFDEHADPDFEPEKSVHQEPLKKQFIEDPDRFLDLGEPTTPTKKNVGDFDTTKSDGSSAEKPSSLSTAPPLPPLFSASQSMIDEGAVDQMMEKLDKKLQQIISGVKPKKHRLPEVAIPGEKKPKEDEKKHCYVNSFRFIVKEMLTDKYSGFVRRLCRKFKVKDEAQLRDFYSERAIHSVALKDLRSYLNPHQHGPEESMRAVKQAFQVFYVWFMRKRYTNHILTGKIVHKEEYLEAKNYLMCLPELKPNRNSKARQPNRNSKARQPRSIDD